MYLPRVNTLAAISRFHGNHLHCRQVDTEIVWNLFLYWLPGLEETFIHFRCWGSLLQCERARVLAALWNQLTHNPIF